MPLSSLTDQDKNLLLRLSYYDLPPGAFSSGSNLSDVLASMELAQTGRGTDADTRNALFDQIRANPGLSDLKLMDYENRNPDLGGKTGFVGYCFEDGGGEKGFLFRGTENDHWVDWADNASASTLGESPQTIWAKVFFARNANESMGNYLLGHSKGGNLAAEVYADFEQRVSWAHVVNAQPIAWHALTPWQQAAFKKDKFDFVVVQGDVVSLLGQTPYKTRYVHYDPRNPRDPFDPHNLEAVAFGDDGAYRAASLPDWIQPVYATVTTVWSLAESADRWLKDKVQAAMDVAARYVRLAAQAGFELADRLKEKFISGLKTIAGIGSAIIKGIKDVFAAVKRSLQNLLKRALGKMRGAAAGLGAISVNTSDLRAVAARLRSVQARITRVDRALGQLVWLVEPDKKPAVQMISWTVGYDYSVARCAAFLNASAQRLDGCEANLVGQARRRKA